MPDDLEELINYAKERLLENIRMSKTWHTDAETCRFFRHQAAEWATILPVLEAMRRPPVPSPLPERRRQLQLDEES